MKVATAVGRHAGKEGAMSLIRNSALPNQFRSGNTSDNTPFALLLWIRASFFSRFAYGEGSLKALVFSAISYFYTYTIVPPA